MFTLLKKKFFGSTETTPPPVARRKRRAKAAPLPERKHKVHVYLEFEQRNAVRALIDEHPDISRTLLATVAGVSPSTISNLARVVKETEEPHD